MKFRKYRKPKYVVTILLFLLSTRITGQSPENTGAREILPYNNFTTEYNVINCFVAGLPPDDFALDNIENLSEFLQKKTGYDVRFRFLGLHDLHAKTLEEAISKAINNALRDDIPPDIIVDTWRGLIGFTAFEHLEIELFSNIRELARTYAPDVYQYIFMSHQTWSSPYFLQSQAPIRNIKIWLLKQDVYQSLNNPRINSMIDLISYLKSVASKLEWRYPGVRPSYNPVSGYLHFFLPNTLTPIANLYSNGLYLEKGEANVHSIFDEYPVKLKAALGECYKIAEDALFEFNITDPADLKDRLLRNDWAAFSLSVGTKPCPELLQYSRIYGLDNVFPIVLDDNAPVATAEWPGGRNNYGILIPSVSGKAALAMQFLQAIAAPELVEAIHYGVPEEHYTRSSRTGRYESIDSGFVFSDICSNPFAAMCVAERPILFDAHLPDSIFEIVSEALHNNISDDMGILQGFTFDPQAVQDEFDRYNSFHLRRWNRLISGDPADFDARYYEFKTMAEKDYKILKTEIQRQIDLHIGR